MWARRPDSILLGTIRMNCVCADKKKKFYHHVCTEFKKVTTLCACRQVLPLCAQNSSNDKNLTTVCTDKKQILPLCAQNSSNNKSLPPCAQTRNKSLPTCAQTRNKSLPTCAQTRNKSLPLCAQQQNFTCTVRTQAPKIKANNKRESLPPCAQNWSNNKVYHCMHCQNSSTKKNKREGLPLYAQNWSNNNKNVAK